MKNAILIHGTNDTKADYFKEISAYGSKANTLWYPWLAQQLEKLGFSFVFPSLPSPWDSDVDYDEWSNELDKISIGVDTLLIGHSWGAGFILKYLALHPNINIGQLVMIAPSCDPIKKCGNFMNRWDSDKCLHNRIKSIDLLYSTDDKNPNVSPSVEKIKKLFANKSNFRIYKFDNKGHFVSKVGNQLPELLQIIR